MKCEQARECVDEYIKKTLPERTQEEFIKHVKKCPECFQELETYYIVDVAIKYFEEGKGDSYDISNLLYEDLNKRLNKRKHKRRIIIALTVVAVIAAFLVLGLGLHWFGI